MGLNYDLWDYSGPGLYSFDMLVDANNRVHFFGVVVNLTTSQRAVVEIYETASGWNSHFIQNDLKESTNLTYPGTAGALNQMGNHLNAAISPSGDVMALVWLDAAVQGDTLPDIWFSWRRIADANWSTPVNLTQTPGFAELLLHAAPTLRQNGPNSYTIFVGRSYEAGVTTYPPENANRTVFYAGSYGWTITDVNDKMIPPTTFFLAQNYPNPFNPSTVINFQITFSSFVTLKVYDVLGREVATLVNERLGPGSYESTFNAGGLASGVYFYRLQAGTFVNVRKLLVLR